MNTQEKPLLLVDSLASSLVNEKNFSEIEVQKYLYSLYEELSEIYSDDVDLEDKKKPEEELSIPTQAGFEPVQLKGSDGNEISFIISLKKDNHISFKCPTCGEEVETDLTVFSRYQFQKFNCQNCHNETLLKLHFEPKIKTYVEK